MSGSSSRRQAASTEAKASLISIRSMSSIDILLRSSSFWVAGIGPVSMITGSTPTVVWSKIRARGSRPSASAFSRRHQQHRGGAVGDLRGVAGGDLAVLLEGRLQLGELLQARVGPDALVGRVGVAVDCEGDDLALEAALLGRLVGELVRAQADLVELGAGDLPLVGDHLGRDPLGDEVVALHQLGRRRRSRARTCTSSRSAKEMWPMCSTPPPMATSWTPEAISAAAKLTACWAEPHWRSTVVAGVSIGRPASQPGVAADVDRLLAELLHTAGDDVLDLGGVDPGALDHLGVGLGEQRRWVGVLVVALLLVAAPDRRAHRLDDDDLAASEFAVAPSGRASDRYLLAGSRPEAAAKRKISN